MPRGIERPADRGDVGADAGRGLVMGRKHRLDAVRGVGAQDLLVALCGEARAPRRLDDLDVELMALAHVDPAPAEHAVLRGKNAIARGERVADRRFPATGPGRREDEDLCVLAFHHLPDAGEGRPQDFRKERRAMVERRHVHGLAQHLRHIGRTGNEDGVLGMHGGASS